ncbi:MAG: response regulator [Paludibacteraceae bacterium]|nr:response regulator [Paludibacteraceae bacterium]
MMVFKRVLKYIVLFLMLFSPLRAMEWATFHHYTVEDGLSCNYVHSITQDKNGFLWVATEYGLNKFDGVHFKKYFFEDYPSLFRNDIIRSALMESGKVCFGGNNGLAVSYDELTDSFHDMAPKDFDTTYFKCVTGIHPISGGRTILSTNAGLYFYDEKSGIFEKDSIPYYSTQDIFSCSLLEDDWGRIWIGSFPGIRVWNTEFKRCGPEFLSNINEMVSSMVRFDHNRILYSSSIGSLGIVYLADDGSFLRTEVIDTPFKCITSLLKDSKGRVWLGTSGSGLWRGECKNDKWKFEKQAPININPDELKKVHTLFEDKDGDIWIGTQNSGLWRYGESKGSSSLHSSDIGFPLVDGTSFVEDSKGNIVVSADGHGCYLLSPDLKIIKHIQTEDGLPSNNVLSLQKGTDGKIWVASWGGVPCTYDTETGAIKQYPFKGIGFAYSTSKVICCFQNGEVGVGLAGDGIYNYSPTDAVWNHVRLLGDTTISSEDRWVEHVMESKQGVRWVITSRSVWRWENNQKKAAYPDIDANQSHNPLQMFQGACDEAGNLFVVSSQGVLRFEADGSAYQTLDFLPSGHYSSILLGRDGRFWTSGSNGILHFDYAKKDYHLVLLDDRCRNRNYFTSRAAYQDSKGRFYFGSTEGFLVFDPALIRESSGVDYFSFTDLSLFGERVMPNSEILPVPLSQTKELVLNYDETNITISFDVLDFSGLNNIDASYRINGLDRRWVDLGDKREVKISHLPFGDYVLEVKANRRDEVDNPKIITLNIRVLPPWWKTWWFTLLVVLGCFAIVAGILAYRFRSIVKQRELLSKMVAERTKELDESNQLLEQKQAFIERRNQDLLDVLREKDRLISVVAHDLKNPMFAIVGALEGVVKKREISPNTWQTLNDTYLSAFNLQSVMVKLLEWARGKQSDVICRMDNVSLHQIITEVLDLLKGVMSDKNIAVNCTFDVKHKVFADSRMIGTAIRNVLTNAAKFTPEGGSIQIDAVEEVDGVRLSITDNGLGMSAERVAELMRDGTHESTLGTKNEKGTGLGFQMTKDFVRKSGGIIELTSEEGKGTTVVIILSKSDELAEISMPQTATETFDVNVDLLDGNTVMIVDDDPLILNNLRDMLSPYLTVISASNGEEGLRVVAEQHPDIIISDVEMPVMDGIEMYKRLRSEQPTVNVPLVFLSARCDEDDRLRGLSSGAIDYVNKPFSSKELLMKLHNILQWRRTQQQQVLAHNLADERIDDEADDLLRHVLEVVEKRYQDSEFSIDDLAADLAMSKSSLSRKLKSITDKTPLEVITEFRLYRAQKMLKAGKSVSDVAYSVGFNDPLYFSRKYRAEFGYPPSQEA